MISRRRLLFLSASLVCLALPQQAVAHALPDVPVRSSFQADGAYTIEVEVNPRCFEADPNTAPSVLKSDLDARPVGEREAWLGKADAFAKSYVKWQLVPQGDITPSFNFEFTAEGGTPLTKADDIVVITGRSQSSVPLGCTGYRIRASESNTLSVLFLNTLRGEPLKRMNVLFPGEESYTLNLLAGADKAAGDATGRVITDGSEPPAPASPSQVAEAAATAPDTTSSDEDGMWQSFVTFIRQGFHHVVPLGLDHILFVLGLFLLSRQWRPLLMQVTAFTIAHTITLGLATLGWVQVPSSIVEPIIAGSIAVVALENIYHPRYTPWRLLIVFCFGLIHGLGFAGALGDLLERMGLPQSSLLLALLGFNVGVEGGQLAVIAIAFAATFWLSDKATAGQAPASGLIAPLSSGSVYRRFVVVPGSLLIAAAGIYWMIERVLG